MDTITLKNLYFFAKHGYHEAERLEGNKFEVDVVFALSLKQPGETDELSQTIDYSLAYQAVQQIMQGPPVKLLETLAEKMGKELTSRFPQAATVKISVRKLNPPLSGPCAYSEVTRTWQKSS
ncbi:MAG: dihydroneopterin aldolase [Balneolales bacterium]